MRRATGISMISLEIELCYPRVHCHWRCSSSGLAGYWRAASTAGTTTGGIPAAATLATASDMPKIAFAPRLPLLCVPSISSISAINGILFENVNALQFFSNCHRLH